MPSNNTEPATKLPPYLEKPVQSTLSTPKAPGYAVRSARSRDAQEPKKPVYRTALQPPVIRQPAPPPARIPATPKLPQAQKLPPAQDNKPLKVPQRTVSKQPKLPIRNVIMGTLAVIGIVTVGITGVRSLQAGRTSLTSPITKIAKQRAATPLYVPRSLPGGYSLVDNTIPQPSESVVIYTIQNQNGHNLYVSQQKQPSSFDFAAFNNSFTNRKVYKLSLGTLTIGEVGSGQIVASLPTGKTWIILNTNKGISYQDILEIFKNLHLDKV